MSEWISIKDRLPETGDEVILLDTSVGNHIVVFLCPDNSWECVNSGDELPEWWDESHWMPLPEPPKALK